MLYTYNDSSFDLPSLDELITLQKSAELSGLPAGHLRLFVRRGKPGSETGPKLGHYRPVKSQCQHRPFAILPTPKPPQPCRLRRSTRRQAPGNLLLRRLGCQLVPAAGEG